MGACPAPLSGTRLPGGGPPTPRWRTSPPTWASPSIPFQVEACEALEEGAGRPGLRAHGCRARRSWASSPIHKALAEGRKAFYTTPIKALSNQKYADLVERYGAKKVGLLTGDNAINGDAPVVVMTTEVLRNMLYADSPGASTASATSSWTRCTTSPTGSAARSGRR